MKQQNDNGKQASAGRANLLDLLQEKQLTAKEIAENLDLPIRSVYRYLGTLASQGSILKLEKLVNGKPVSIYSLPSIAPGVCNWQAHCEMLLAGRTYSKAVLENDFWKPFAQDLRNLASRQENRHIAVVGLTGWGKSCTAIWLAKYLDPSFNVRDVIFLQEDLLGLVASQPRNKTFVFDDVGVMLSSHQWQQRERELIFNFLEICRVNKVSTIGTAPTLPMIDINYQRLLHCVLQVELKCRDHIHIIAFKPTTAGLKPSFQPVGVLFFPYPKEVDPLIQDYERLKQRELGLSARASLAKLQRAEEGVRQYVLDNDIPRVTEDHLQAALALSGFDGAVSKIDKIKLRAAMFVAWQAKKRSKKRGKKIHAESSKTSSTISKQQSALSKQQSAYTKKFQGYLDQGKDEVFARTLAQRETQKKMNPDHWKKVISASKAIQKRGIESNLIDRFTLKHIDDPYLVVALKQRNEILDEFKGFPKDFTTKLWLMMNENPRKAKTFIDQVMSLKSSIIYQDKKGKFSPKKWQESVLARFNLLEAGERRKRIEEERERAEQERWERIAHHATKLFGGLFG